MVEAEGGVGLGAGLGIDAVLVAIADDVLAVDDAGAVLAADGIEDGDGGDGLPDLELFAAHAFGLEAGGRLEGDEREQLHHVVLDDVAQGAGLLVEGAAAFDAEGFSDGDLHVVDVVAFPDRLEDAVGEAEDEEVLDGLLAEVVIDAEDLALVEDGVDLMVELAGGVEVVAEGLLDDDGDAAFFGLRHALRAEILDDAGKELGRGGEIEEAIGADSLLCGDAVEFGFQSWRSGKDRRS